MSDFPIQAIIMPVVMIGVVGFMYFRGHKLRAQYLQDNPQYGIGMLAQRWGLTLLEGDPAYNLYINSRDNEVAMHTPAMPGLTGNTPAHGARMQGNHRGHPVQFEFYDQTKIERGAVTTTYTRNYRCVLTVAVQANVPPFELVLRNENQYLVVERQLHLPEQRFGQPQLDATLLLMSHEPRVGAALASVVAPLTVMTYVHVVGGDGCVRFVMSPLGTSYGAYYAEPVLQVLLAMADVLEGKAPPAVAMPAAGGPGMSQAR